MEILKISVGPVRNKNACSIEDEREDDYDAYEGAHPPRKEVVMLDPKCNLNYMLMITMRSCTDCTSENTNTSRVEHASNLAQPI